MRGVYALIVIWTTWVLFAHWQAPGTNQEMTSRSAVPLPTYPELEQSTSPPTRYQQDVASWTVWTSDLGKHCGDPPAGKKWGGCVRGGVMYLPNSCLYQDQSYARLTCHESAHINGWTGKHEQ